MKITADTPITISDLLTRQADPPAMTATEIVLRMYAAHRRIAKAETEFRESVSRAMPNLALAFWFAQGGWTTRFVRGAIVARKRW